MVTIDRATVVLNNLGAGALGQVAPDAAIVPAAGTVFGEVRIVLDAPAFECETDLTLTNVEFAVNRASPVMVGRADGVSRDLEGLARQPQGQRRLRGQPRAGPAAPGGARPARCKKDVSAANVVDDAVRMRTHLASV